MATAITVGGWLKAACADAERRGLPELKPLLETLSRSTTSLREADATLAAAEHRDPAASERSRHEGLGTRDSGSSQ